MKNILLPAIFQTNNVRSKMSRQCPDEVQTGAGSFPYTTAMTSLACMCMCVCRRVSGAGAGVGARARAAFMHFVTEINASYRVSTE